MPHTHSLSIVRLLALLVLLLSSVSMAAPTAQVTPPTYIVQAQSAAAADSAVRNAGGTVTRPLTIINGVVATLPDDAVQRLAAMPGVALHGNAPVSTAGGKETDTDGLLLYPSAATGATKVAATNVATNRTTCTNARVSTAAGQDQKPLQGWGVTVAVIDSGFMEMQDSNVWQTDSATGALYAQNAGRCIIYRDFLPKSTANSNNGKKPNSTDQYGHGTHVISTIADNRATGLKKDKSGSAQPVGVAPKVNLVVARALGADGSGTYADVISAIEWVVANKATFNVRVLNLSLYSPVSGPYWADPLNQAVMKAWQAGIVVVAAAGNDGSDAGTITVPGNVPYVITVGAIKSGRYTTSGQDELATYSSRGPTESAFVKPDVLVPASRTIAPMPDGSTLAVQLAAECSKNNTNPQPCIETKADVDYGIGKPSKKHTYFYLSGTSMASAEVSGIVALMLQRDPSMNNNQIKARLMATARSATDTTTSQSVYTPWEQGAGLVDTQQAVFSTYYDSANKGMDIALDLNPNSTTHYWGYTTWDSATGTFKLIDPTTGGQLAVWDTRSRSWAGSGATWAGRSRSWAGSGATWAGRSRSWAGNGATWAGSDSLWAGRSRSWAGSTPNTALNTASHAEMLTSP